MIKNQRIKLTYKNINLEWIGGIDLYKMGKIKPIPKTIIGSTLVFIINKNVKLTYNNFKKLLKNG